MIVIMKHGATDAAIKEVVREITEHGLKADVIKGEKSTVIGMVGDTSAINKDDVLVLPEVDLALCSQKVKAVFIGVHHIDGAGNRQPAIVMLDYSVG